MKMTMKSALALALAGVTAGCLDLDIVSNQSAPTAEQVLSEPAETELVVAGTWETVWEYLENNTSSLYAMGALGHEWVSGNSTLFHYSGPEPRVAYPNDYALSNRFVSQNPWYSIYEGIDDANQALKKIELGGMKLNLADDGETTPTDKTNRARAFAYYTQGVLYGLLALNYDQASVSLHTTDKTQSDWWEYKPYTEIAEVAIQQLEKSIEIAQANSFTIPATWMGGTSLDSQGLIRMAHSHIARIMAYLPRTPAERQAVNWQEVISHADQGIKQNFVVTLSSTGLTAQFIRYQGSTGIMMADPRLYGPADVSGAYAAWMAKPISERDRFQVVTPDRRITGATPTTNGTYFRYAATCCSSAWPTYLRGHYYWYRHLNRWNSGTKVHMSVDEMNLLKAEGYLRLGQTQQAVDLINITRVNNGKLPALTTAGVPGDLSSCVPRNFEGTACGDLLDALHHERMIELAGLHNFRSWWDRRGFGTLAEGTYTQLPVPTRELQALGQPWYTFGGTAESSADGVPEVR